MMNNHNSNSSFGYNNTAHLMQQQPQNQQSISLEQNIQNSFSNYFNTDLIYMANNWNKNYYNSSSLANVNPYNQLESFNLNMDQMTTAFQNTFTLDPQQQISRNFTQSKSDIRINTNSQFNNQPNPQMTMNNPFYPQSPPIFWNQLNSGQLPPLIPQHVGPSTSFPNQMLMLPVSYPMINYYSPNQNQLQFQQPQVQQEQTNKQTKQVNLNKTLKSISNTNSDDKKATQDQNQSRVEESIEKSNKLDQTMIKSSNDEQKSNKKQDSKSKYKLIKMRKLDEKHAENILANFKCDLLQSDLEIKQSTSKYSERTCSYLYSIIVAYMEHLEERLKIPEITYVDLIDGRIYPYEDFFSLGERFWIFIKYCDLFPSDEIMHLKILNMQYLSLYPKDILDFREQLLKLKMRLSKNKNNFEIMHYPIDYKWFTYQQIDQISLYNAILNLNSYQEKFKYFNSKYSLSEQCRRNMMKFVHFFEKILCKQFIKFSPTVHVFGSFSNGLGTCNSDFDLFVKFKNINADILDFFTSLLALEVIEQLMKHEIGLQIKNSSTIIQSRRCPIIKLNFKNCLRHLATQIPRELKPITEFTKCDISLGSMYGVYNSSLLFLFTNYDRRFYEMTMSLKYWAKNNNLISQQMFSTYAFTLLIVYFLQQQEPPILPTVSRLLELEGKHNPLIVHKWNFNFCKNIRKIGHSKNNTPTPILLVKFFKYYSSFNFYFYAIRPRQGKIISKQELSKEKERENLTLFNMSSYFCIEDPFVLDHNVAYNFRSKNVYHFFRCLNIVAGKITKENCLNVLLEKSINIDIGPDIYPACNFFKYELYFNQDQDTFMLQPIERTLSVKDLDKLWQTLIDFFAHIIRYLLKYYFFLENFEVYIHNDHRTLTCYIDVKLLNNIITSKHWDHLRQFLNRKNPNSVELLKAFRNKFKKEIEKMKRTKLKNNLESNEWFKLFYSCQDYNMFTYFDVYCTVKRTFPLLDVIISLLQSFLFRVDRNNPLETFNNAYNIFLKNGH